jgi:hypothetical protein
MNPLCCYAFHAEVYPHFELIPSENGAFAAGLHVLDYRDLLLETIFAPSPIGNYNLDCFRTWETIECGAIPIIVAPTYQQPYDYFR